MPDEERELTPQQEADVRRLLGEARATEPLPAEVAARLEQVLIGLGEERGGARPVAAGHVVALATRRRRATYLLVAATAVVAVGIGLGQVVNTQGGSDSDSGGAADTSVSAERVAPSAQEDRVSGEAAEPESTDGADFDSGATTPPLSETRAGRVRTASFTADANQLRRALPDQSADGEFVQLAADQLPPGYVLGPRAFDCAAASWGHGVLVPVYVDGTPAVLAYRPVTGESQVVDLLQCGTGEKLRSATLQAG
jgi:hypothetical protein